MRKRCAYKTVDIDPDEGFLTGVRRGILTPDLAQGVWAAKTGRYVAMLERDTSSSTGQRSALTLENTDTQYGTR